jgi:hypothetical protein
MLRYLDMYNASAGFELQKTHRYAKVSKKEESCLVATKDWQTGEEIKHCTAVMVELSKSEENTLSQDFSVIWSEKKKVFHLLLGPVRFVNHDCEPNVEVKFKLPSLFLRHPILYTLKLSSQSQSEKRLQYFMEKTILVRITTAVFVGHVI